MLKRLIFSGVTAPVLWLIICATGSPAKEIFVAASGNDSSAGGSLVEAVLTIGRAIELAEDGDTVLVGEGSFAAGAGYDFDLSLVGEGAGLTTLTGRLHIEADASVGVSGVWLADGVENFGDLMMQHCDVRGSIRDEEGAGIRNHGVMNFSDGKIQNNATPDGVRYSSGEEADAKSGAGIYNSGTFVLVNSVVSGNRCGSGGTTGVPGSRDWPGDVGEGGGIFNAEGGDMTIESVIFARNSAGHSDQAYYGIGYGGHGGAIYNAGEMTISSSLFDRNTAGAQRDGNGCNCISEFGKGGAVCSTGVTSLINCTMTGTSVGYEYFGQVISLYEDHVYVKEDGTATLTHCTNRAAIWDQEGIRLGHCLLINYSSAPDHGLGPNLSVPDTEIGALGAHRGSIPGYPPLPGSSAIGAGALAGTFPTLDQRGFQRVSGDRIDIGALEFNAPQTFAEWVEASLPAGDQTGALDDWDGDSRNNLQEFSEGTDPSLSDFAPVQIGSVPSGGQDLLDLTFRTNPVATGLTWCVEVSTDLQDWSPVYGLADSQESILIDGDTYIISADSQTGGVASDWSASGEMKITIPFESSSSSRIFVRIVSGLQND